jgi:hypothetical protein
MSGIMMSMMNNVSAGGEAPYTPPTPLTSNLYAWYDPKSTTSYPGTGTTLFDLSGNSRNATLVGPTYDSEGFFTFDGTNDYIVSPNLYNGSGNLAHTIEVWINLTNIDDCVWSDMGEPDPATTGYHFAGSQILGVGPFQQIITGLWNGTAITRTVAGSGSLANNWIQVVRTFDGTGLNSYLNGVAANDPVAMTWDPPWESGLVPGNDWYIAFGAEDTTTYSGSTAGWFAGKYGIIRVYTSALSSSDVLSNYNTTKSVYGIA